MPEVNGRRVVFKDSLTNREAWNVSPVLAALAEASKGERTVKAILYALGYDDALRLLTTIIESWEFDGEPSDQSCYEALDLYQEIIPMFTAALQHLGVQRAAQGQSLGESVSEST